MTTQEQVRHEMVINGFDMNDRKFVSDEKRNGYRAVVRLCDIDSNCPHNEDTCYQYL